MTLREPAGLAGVPQDMTARAILLSALVLVLAQPACKSSDPKETSGKAKDPGSATVPAAAGDVAPSGAGTSSGATAPAAPLPADPGGAGGAHEWSIRMGGVQADTARAIAADNKGHVYLTGTIRATAEFGPAGTIEASGVDGFLARVSPKGTIEWTRRLGSEGDDIASSVAIDPSGNAVVVGWFSQTISIGDGKLESVGADDVFVASFDPAGARRWAARFGGADVDGADGVAVDRSGNVALIGSYKTDVDVAKAGHVAAGGTDILIIMLDKAGVVKWSKSWGQAGPDEGRAVGFDAAGNLYALVEFSRGVDFGGGQLISAGNRDMAIVKMSPDGGHIWSRRFGSQLDELALGLAVDPSGSVIVTGSFDDVLDMGVGEPLRTTGRSDVFVAKLDPAGKTAWVRQLGDTDEDIGASVATDPFGNVYASGWFWKTLSHGDKPLASRGKKDAFLVAFSPAGDPLWGRTFGEKEEDFGRAVTASADAIYLAGTFHKSIDLGGGELKAAGSTKASVPFGDVFVAKLAR